jgi:TRAP-type C4-dicarboxylate transport system substrate-binding protein
MKVTRRHFFRSSLLATAVSAIANESARAALPSRVRLGTLVPKGSSYYRNLQLMGEKWRVLFGGTLALTVYPDGAMGGEAEMVRRMRQNQLHAGLLTTVGLRAIEPDVTGLQNLPLMFHDLDDVDYIGDRMHPALEQKIAKNGFVVLFWADAGWVRFFTKTPVRTPEEMKRLKIFCWAGDPNQLELMRNVGLRPVSLETADILPGLKTGLIDAVPMPPFMALATQVDLAAPYMLELNYAPLVGAALMNKSVWDEVPVDKQASLLEIARATGQVIKTDSRAEAVASVAAMKKRGLTVHVPTPGEIGQWRQFLEKAYPTIRQKIVPTAMFDVVERLLKERHALRAGAVSKP